MTELTLAAVLPSRRRPKAGELQPALDLYISRAAKYLPCASLTFDSEDALLTWSLRAPGRAAAHLILFDSRGTPAVSEDFAALLGRLRDEGTQRIIFAIGPADGWSKAARDRAQTLLSFGRITLPHDLARVVAAEQIYRALTILAGHPYHLGH